MRRLVACVLIVGSTATAQERSAADRQLADLQVVRQQYVLASKALSPEARTRALALVADAETRAGRLTKPELHLRLLEIVALADNGHDVLTFGTDAARPDLRMPFRVAWFPDALIVVRATGEAADLAGSRIESVEGLAPPELYRRLLRYTGGVEAQRRLQLGIVLESPGLLHAAGIAAQPDRLTLKVRTPAGRLLERTVQAIAGRDVPRGFGLERLLAPDPVNAAEAAWVPALARDNVPLALRDGNSYFRMEQLLGGALLYVQFRINFSFAGQDIDAFQRRVTAALQLQAPTDVIVDLRFNTGGDLQTTLDFMRSLPSRVPGRIFVLISRYTFSAGIVSAAAIRKAGGDRVVLVGEPPGDRMRFWSEGGNACLADSGFCLRFTSGLIDLRKGCAGEPDCYGDQFDVTVGSLDPDIAAPLTAADYLARRDRALDAVLDRVK